MKYCKVENKKVMTFNLGDFVSIKDRRSSTDIRRLPSIVVQKLGSKLFISIKVGL